jgi:cytochrome bd-type quinol oxidase subunit 1
MNPNDETAVVIFGILFLLFIAALVYVIVNRVKEKKKEDFEDRKW